MTTQPTQQSADSEGLSLRLLILKTGAMVRYLLRRWLVILVFALVGGGLMVAYSLLKQTEYRGAVNFVLDESAGQSGPLGAAAGIASQLGINLGGLSESGGFFQGDNIIEFLLSRSMIEKTLLSEVEVNGEKELLVDRYVRFRGLRNQWAKHDDAPAGLQFRDTSGVFLQDSLMAQFYDTIVDDYLTVKKPDKKLNIIEVAVESPDAWFSKEFVTTLIDNASDFYIRTKTQRAQENLDVLTHQVDSVRRALNSAIRGVASAQDANPNPNKAFQSLRVPSQLRTVDVRANTEILEQLVANQEMAKIALRNAKPIIQILDRPIMPLENDHMGWKFALVIGGFLGGFLCVLVLLARKLYRHIMAGDLA